MSRRAVLFDFDGTLADTIPLTVASYRHALTGPGGKAPTEAVIRSWSGRPLLETLETHRPGVVSSTRADMVRQGMRATELPSDDVQAARAAGMAAVAVTWGAGEEEALRALGPDAVVRDIAELRTALADLLPFD